MKKLISLLFILQFLFGYSQQIKVAIVDFENTSGIAKYDGLGKAMSSMLISDIEVNVSPKRLQLIERSQINKILKEQNFQKTSSVDKASSVKMGKLLGVKYLLVGDIFVLNDALVINSRLVDTETGDIKFTEKKEGKLAQWLFLKTALAKGLATSISMPFTEPVVIDKEINSAIVTTFSNAITEKDKGNLDKSEDLLKIVEEFSADFKYIDDIKEELEKLKKQLNINTEDIEVLKKSGDLVYNAKSYNELKNNVVSQLSGYREKNENIAKIINNFPTELENEPSYLILLSSITSEFTPCDQYISFYTNSLKSNDIVKNNSLKLKYYLYQLKFNECFESKTFEEKLNYFEKIDFSINEYLLKKTSISENEKAIINLYFFYVFIEDYINPYMEDNDVYKTILLNKYIEAKIQYLRNIFLKSYENQLSCSKSYINITNLNHLVSLMINELDETKLLIVENYFDDDQFRDIQKNLKSGLVNIGIELKIIPNRVASDIITISEKKYLSKTKYLDPRKYFDVLNKSNLIYLLIYYEYYQKINFAEVLNSEILMKRFIEKIEDYERGFVVNNDTPYLNKIYLNYNIAFSNTVKNPVFVKCTNTCDLDSFEAILINGNMPDFKTYFNSTSKVVQEKLKNIDYVFLNTFDINVQDKSCCGSHSAVNSIIWCKNEIDRFKQKVKQKLKLN